MLCWNPNEQRQHHAARPILEVWVQCQKRGCTPFFIERKCVQTCETCLALHLMSGNLCTCTQYKIPIPQEETSVVNLRTMQPLPLR